jgi:copper chaperone CopZ
MDTVKLEIKGMNRAASMNGVRSALSVIRGVTEVELSLERGQAIVRYNPDKVVPEQFKKAVWVMGCEVEQIVVQHGV